MSVLLRSVARWHKTGELKSGLTGPERAKRSGVELMTNWCDGCEAEYDCCNPMNEATTQMLSLHTHTHTRRERLDHYFNATLKKL